MNKGRLIGLLILSDLIVFALFGLAYFQNRASGDWLSSPLFFIALGLFFLLPVVAVALSSQTPGSTDLDLLRTGQVADAVVLAVGEARPGSDNSQRVRLKLQVNLPNADPFETSVTALVPPLNPAFYQAGMAIRVRYDPRHPRRVVVDDGSGRAAQTGVNAGAGGPAQFQTRSTTRINVQMPEGAEFFGDPQNTSQGGFTIDPAQIDHLPPAIQNIVQAALVDADQDGIPDIVGKAGLNSGNVQVINLGGRDGAGGQITDPQGKIEKLAKLRAAGLINQEQFEQARKAIETAAGNRRED